MPDGGPEGHVAVPSLHCGVPESTHAFGTKTGPLGHVLVVVPHDWQLSKLLVHPFESHRLMTSHMLLSLHARPWKVSEADEVCERTKIERTASTANMLMRSVPFSPFSFILS
jgi:hypothetical protein